MRLLIVGCVFLCQISLYAQVTPQTKPQTKRYSDHKDPEIIEGVAFDKMVSQHITYAITGEKVPTSGVKVDLTKATGTLTGHMVNENGFDMLIDLGVGVTEGSAALFDSQTRLHSDFSATVSLVFTPKMSWARMYPVAADIIRTSRPIYKTNLYTNKSDSLLCVLLIIKAHQLEVEDQHGNWYEFDPASYLNEQLMQKDKLKKKEYQEAIAHIRAMFRFEASLRANKFIAEDTAKLSCSQLQLLRDLTKRYFPEVKTHQLVSAYNTLSQVTGRSDLMLADLMKTMNAIISAPDQFISYQLNLADKYWTIKTMQWVTVAPFIRRQAFSLFDQTALDRKDTSSLVTGAGVRFNHMVLWHNFFFYGRIGGDFFRANNLSDFTKVEYFQQDSLTTAKGKYLYSEKKGVSYTGAELKHDFGFTFSVETYFFFSKKNFIPGLFIKYDVTNSKVLKNRRASSLEFGLPFNINSPDKTKSVVSVAPYMRLPYLSPQNNVEVANKIEMDDFQVGLRIGLPISIASK